jgi:hypothetical protein
MPNQENFRSDLTQLSQERKFVSRIIKVPEEGILFEELPGSFGYDSGDNVEIHFYTAQGNTLLLSVISDVSDESVFKFHTVEYDDGSIQTYLRIDFTELMELKNVILLPGEYKMVLNFFSDEIGSYNNKKLYIQEISPSRTEIQLGFVDNISPVKINENENLLKEFVPKSFDKLTAIGIAEIILVNSYIENDADTGLTFNQIFTEQEKAKISRANLTLTAQTSTQEFLTRTLETFTNKIIERLDERIQLDDFLTTLEESLQDNLSFIRERLQFKLSINQ